MPASRADPVYASTSAEDGISDLGVAAVGLGEHRLRSTGCYGPFPGPGEGAQRFGVEDDEGGHALPAARMGGGAPDAG